ncbi:MAG TPA: SDR family oxidoreductase [Edaphocola sp.]|nr:SDR family oxidoreductase [Edaphocola sp.]
MKVKGKVFVVTGAGSGIGKELSIQLVKMGAKVAMADIHEDGMNEVARIVGKDNVSIHILNIADKERVEAFPKLVIQHHGTVDGIINNAGIIQPFIDVKDLDYEKIENIMNINFFGLVYMTKSFLPFLINRPEAHITNVSSMGGFIPFPGQTVYGASKAAVKLFTEGLYAELKNTNVGVTIILPGAVNTNIMVNSGLEAVKDNKTDLQNSNKTLSAEKAAQIIIEAIEKNKFRALVGKDARMLDKFYRIHPRKAVDFITKQMSKMKH